MPASGANAGQFNASLDRFMEKVRRRATEVHGEVATELYGSVVNGSNVTGAPGQPVDTGNLRTSWQLIFPERLVAEIVTNVVYAPAIEAGVGRYGKLTLRSEVGGFHSVKLTRLGFKKVVVISVKKVASW